jgi:biopolymer transport protein ExbB
LDATRILELLNQGGLTVYPLALGSVLALWILFERLWRFRGITQATRQLTHDTIEKLVRRDLAGARGLCEASKAPIAKIFLEAMRWRNIALEDLERVLSTARQEAVAEMRRGLWMLGTIGSLAPFVGLFGTVVGIMKAFRQIAIQGSGGFAVVAAGISEALVATAVGLGVAIVALSFYNYLQVRVGNIGSGWARSAERLVQSLLYVESALQPPSQTPPPASAPEVGRGHPLPA